jgi:hypothetical protein
MPPQPIDPPGSDPKQYRISTGLAYPYQASESLQRHRLGPEPFDWTPWLPKGRERKKPQQTEQPDGVSARQVVRLTRQWWGKQRRRGPVRGRHLEGRLRRSPGTVAGHQPSVA